jgi:hypothetical protein
MAKSLSFTSTFGFYSKSLAPLMTIYLLLDLVIHHQSH